MSLTTHYPITARHNLATGPRHRAHPGALVLADLNENPPRLRPLGEVRRLRRAGFVASWRRAADRFLAAVVVLVVAVGFLAALTNGGVR